MYELYPHVPIVNPNHPAILFYSGFGLMGITLLTAFTTDNTDDTIMLFIYSLGCFAIGTVLQLTLWTPHL